MKNLLTEVRKKVNHFIISQILTGIFLLILGFMIVYTDFMLKLVVGLVVITVAYAFFYGAYKLWVIKKEVEKFFKI